MNIYILSGFYAESPDDDDVGDDDRRSCDGPCASADSDASRPTICSVQRDHPTDVHPADDQRPSSTIGTGMLDDWPLTMLSSGGGTLSKTVLGRFRLLLMLLTASLPTRRCAVILFNLLLFSINCLVHVRLIRCLPDSFVNR